jgi:hypothetical protein
MVALFCQHILVISLAFQKKLKKSLKKAINKRMLLNVDFVLFKVLFADNQLFIYVSVKMLKC